MLASNDRMAAKIGQDETLPEIDKAAWFDLNNANKKILETQAALIRKLETKLQKVQ